MAVALLLLLAVAPQTRAHTALPGPQAVAAMVTAGQFKAADEVIDAALASKPMADARRRAYRWQRERMRRMRMDFSLDAAQAKARLKRVIPDLTDAEFATWTESDYLEHMTIDGELRYFRRGISNLFLLSDQARARRAKPMQRSSSSLMSLSPLHVAVREAAAESGKQHVQPRRYRFTQTLTVDANAVPPGETLKVWVPYPQAIPGQQENIRFVTSQPAKHRLAPADTAQRTVYLQQVARAGEPTVFKVSYELTIFAQFTEVDPARVVAAEITPALAPFVAERPPHIVFTPQMRLFSEQIVGDETNPWRIAQKLFAAVDHIPWAGAREYSTIANISDYALHAGHADCGQQTLLLMTLLRMNGIPARWQSGMMFAPDGYWNLHDWGWLYIAPYGWLPMDVTFGALASDDPEIASFYLGGLDGYRLAFNNGYGHDFVPAKTSFRSDTVDSQRGEVEWQGGNLYYDHWSYDLQWSLLADGPEALENPSE